MWKNRYVTPYLPLGHNHWGTMSVKKRILGDILSSKMFPLFWGLWSDTSLVRQLGFNDPTVRWSETVVGPTTRWFDKIALSDTSFVRQNSFLVMYLTAPISWWYDIPGWSDISFEWCLICRTKRQFYWVCSDLRVLTSLIKVISHVSRHSSGSLSLNLSQAELVWRKKRTF